MLSLLMFAFKLSLLNFFWQWQISWNMKRRPTRTKTLFFIISKEAYKNFFSVAWYKLFFSHPMKRNWNTLQHLFSPNFLDMYRIHYNRWNYIKQLIFRISSIKISFRMLFVIMARLISFTPKSNNQTTHSIPFDVC